MAFEEAKTPGLPGAPARALPLDPTPKMFALCASNNLHWARIQTYCQNWSHHTLNL